ncbi:MAG: sensor histidine kinase [Anaerolineae bacterium]
MKQWFSISSSIQAKMTGLFLISVLLTIALVVTFNNSIRGIAVSTSESALQVRAEQLANQIDEFNLRNLQTFAIASNLPTLLDFYSLSPRQQNNEIYRNEVRNTLNTLQVYPADQFYALSFALLDLDGHNLIDTFLDYEGMDESGLDFIQTVLTSGKPTVSTVYFEPLRGGAFFYYAIPIRENNRPRSTTGILRVQFSVASIQDLILENLPDRSTHVILLDEHDVRLIDTRNPITNFRTVRQPYPAQANILRAGNQLPPIADSDLSVPLPDIVPYLDTMNETRIVNASIQADNNQRETVAIIPLTTQPWLLLYTHYDTSTSLIERQTQGILTLSLVLTFGAVAIAFWLSRNLSQPIRKLTETAQIASQGNLDVKVSVTSSDEVGKLAHAFNVMITELKQTKNTLEERVHQRTQALSETNLQLKKEIEERKRLETRNIQLALESERGRILGGFIQDASHEFKTPLSIINVQSHLIGRLLDETQQHRVQEIIGQSKNIETLINKMVLMTQLDSDTHELRLDQIFVDEFVSSVCLSEEQAFQQQAITLKTQLNAPNCSIISNGRLLFEAIKNILDNAIQSTAKGGTVLVETLCKRDHVQITIRDDGIGIHEDEITRVFERFYRVDQARTNRGFGLGLPITKRIVERFGGTITLSSEINAGTSVIMRFPIEHNAPESA